MTGEIRGISDPDKTGSISVSQCASINREILPGVQVRLCSQQRGDTVCISGASATGETLHFEAQVQLKAR